MKTKKYSKLISLILTIGLILSCVSSLGLVCSAADFSASEIENEIPTKYDVLAGADTYDEKTIEQVFRTRSQTVHDGTYYLNNDNSGKYLRYSSSLSAQSGLISSLGNSIRWEITYNGSYYYIQPVSDSTKYLAVSTSSGSNAVELVTVTSSTVPTQCKWSISIATGGGCLVKNAYNSKYLKLSGSSVSATSTTGTSGTATYASCVWRVAGTDYYGNTSSHTKRELMSGFSITCNNVDVGETLNQKVTKNPTNALWANKYDFTYTTSNTSRVSINGYTLTALSRGSASITATHKVTGLTKTFSVSIFPGTFDVYIFASGISLDNMMSGSMAGHGWIEIISNSAHEYTIGHYELAAGKTAKSILISCGARLAPFDIAELRELMSYDEMELDTIGDRKTALFVIISDTDDTFNFVVAIMYSQLFNLLCDKADDVYNGRLPVHVRCLLDEFANSATRSTPKTVGITDKSVA